MKEKYYLGHSEMQYKDVKPYILIERNLCTDTGMLPDDYKFYCMNGKSLYVMVCEDREIGKKAKYFYFDKETVSKYEKCEHIGGISLYKHETHPGVHRPFIPDFNGFDAYLMQFAQSWGQCWTRVMWQDFKNWYEKNEKADLGRDSLLPSYIANWNSQSWLKYYMRYLVETNKYFVYPYISLSTNASDIGEHNKNANNDFQVALLSGRKEYNLPDFENAIRYDVYFERQNIENQIFNEYKGKKVIDLYGQKKIFLMLII